MDGSTAQKKMTVREFADWADARPDDTRYELLNGEIVAQSGVLGRHVKAVKGMERALDSVLPASCTAYAGMGVTDGDDLALIPDLLVLCGREIGDEERYVHDPLIVVEVLSPSTAARDMGQKLSAYQRLPSLAHYLVVHPVERFVLIHSAGPERDWSIVRAAREDFALDPPGVTVPFAPVFARMGRRADLGDGAAHTDGR